MFLFKLVQLWNVGDKVTLSRRLLNHLITSPIAVVLHLLYLLLHHVQLFPLIPSLSFSSTCPCWTFINIICLMFLFLIFIFPSNHNCHLPHSPNLHSSPPTHYILPPRLYLGSPVIHLPRILPIPCPLLFIPLHLPHNNALLPSSHLPSSPNRLHSASCSFYS